MTEPQVRLAKLRQAMIRLDIDAVIVPTADPHLSEYVPPHWALRRALSGFTGSAGTLIVTERSAALIADSRYWVQAEEELIPGIFLIRLNKPVKEHIAEWLMAEHTVGKAFTVGFDPQLVSASQAALLEKRLAAEGFRVLFLEGDKALPLADIWPDRPAMPQSRIRLMRRPGPSAKEKLSALRERIAAAGADAALFAGLDEVAWITNLRGSDVPCNPVFLAYLIVSQGEAELFADAARLEPSAAEALAAAAISIREPGELEASLARAAAHGRVLADPEGVNAYLMKRIPEAARVKGSSPAVMLKCVKTPAEIAAIDEAHLRDAVALAEFYAELDERLGRGECITEFDAAEMLHAWRAKDPEFFDESFTTISAFGAHAALPHYAPREEGSAVLAGNGLLLIDSGGQYECGTTDITRMTAVGNPSPEMRRDAAIVTRAMLRLLHLRFPEGSTGAQIDAAARMDLWANGMDFGHGTGHGVGYVLNVHEGPVTISPRAKAVPIQPGNVLSDEPGVYRPGRWGVRVENLMVCERDSVTEFGSFLRFRPLTMLPIDVRVFPKPFGEGVEFLNAFNAERRERLWPLVSPRAREWLSRAAAPVEP